MLSGDCAAALASPVHCSPLVRRAAGYSAVQYPLSTDNLTTLCTQTCASSLDDLRSKVEEACSDEIYTDKPLNATGYVYGTGTQNDIYNVEGISVKPVAFIDYYLLGYKLLCMQEEADPPNYCYDLQRHNPSAINPCGPCILGALRAQLEDPRTFDESLAHDYSASVSSCGVTAAPLTTPTPVFMSNSNTAPSNYAPIRTCTGSYVPIPTGVSCDDFAANNSVSTDQMLMSNGLVGGCANWPGDLSQVCIERTCKTYRVQQNDTCLGVAAAHKIRLSQLLSYNPTIDPVCKNFYTKVGHIICVGNQVGYVSPSASTIGSTAVPTTKAPVPSNAADESTRRCSKWYTIQSNDQCGIVASMFGISLADFYYLNPKLDTKCSNLLLGVAYCVATVGDVSTYPGYGDTSTSSTTLPSGWTRVDWKALPSATPPTFPTPSQTDLSFPLASGSIRKCYEMFNNNYGPIPCWAAARVLGVRVRDFIVWNPSVLHGATYNSTNCRLANETQYCGMFYDPADLPSSSSSITYLPAPTDATAGATEECRIWYQTIEGDMCDSVCKTFNIPISSFYQWNPAVGAGCTSFQIDTSYCVMGPGWNHVYYNMSSTAVSSATPTTSTSTATRPSSSTIDIATTSSSSSSSSSPSSSSKTYPTPPAPTQSGIPNTCNTYAIAQEGDGCYQFAARYGISLEQLYTWNPVLNDSCENFWAAEAYCIGVE